MNAARACLIALVGAGCAAGHGTMRSSAAAPATLQHAGAIRDSFRDPAIAPSASQPELRYTCHDPQLAPPRFFRQGPVTIERSGSDTEPRYRFSTAVAAQDGAIRESTCRFRVEAGELRSESLDERLLAPDGTVQEERHLDFGTGTYLEKATGARLPWPPNIYPSPCLGFVLGGFPFDSAQVVRFRLWSEYDAATPMFAVLDGRQAVQVPAGAFDAYRVRMNVDEQRVLGKLALPSLQGYQIARGVLEQMRQPDTVLWLTTSSPHVAVRTETVPGPPGTTRCTIEAVTLDPRIPRLATHPGGPEENVSGGSVADASSE